MKHGDKLRKLLEDRYGTVAKAVPHFAKYISKDTLYKALNRVELTRKQYDAVEAILGVTRQDFFYQTNDPDAEVAAILSEPKNLVQLEEENKHLKATLKNANKFGEKMQEELGTVQDIVKQQSTTIQFFQKIMNEKLDKILKKLDK